MEIPKVKITDSFKITVLICYLLNELGSLSEFQITKILTLDEIVNFFDLTEAFGIVENRKLVNFIEKKGERYYELNEAGRVIAAEANSVPPSVREKTLIEGKNILKDIELRKTISWSIQKRENKTNKLSDPSEASDLKGYNFNIRLLNEFGGPDIMEINLYAPTEDGALDIQRRFLERPLEIVRQIMTMFITDMKRF